MTGTADQLFETKACEFILFFYHLNKQIWLCEVGTASISVWESVHDMTQSTECDVPCLIIMFRWSDGFTCVYMIENVQFLV